MLLRIIFTTFLVILFSTLLTIQAATLWTYSTRDCSGKPGIELSGIKQDGTCAFAPNKSQEISNTIDCDAAGNWTYVLWLYSRNCTGGWEVLNITKQTGECIDLTEFLKVSVKIHCSAGNVSIQFLISVLVAVVVLMMFSI
jgi:hypothetical protein